MSRIYSDGEIQSLCHRLTLCNFAASKLELLLKSSSSPTPETDLVTFEDIQYSFYAEALILHFAAFISFFYKNDPNFLKQLNSTSEQQKKIYELRSVPGHILDFDESAKLFDNYFQNAPNLSLIKDFEIIRDFVIGLVEVKNKKEANYLKAEIEETRRLILSSNS